MKKLFNYDNLSFHEKFGSDEKSYVVMCKKDDSEIYQQYAAKR